MLKARTDIYIKPNTVAWIGMLMVLLSLSGCGTTVPLPDYRYYRPKESEIPAPLAQAAIDGVLQIDGFRADGVFGQPPTPYTSQSHPQNLLQYHYHLWTDPPGAILQRRFIDVLAAMKVASSVTARASVRSESYKLSGFIERLERVKGLSGNWTVVVKLRIRVESPRGKLPLLEQTYERNSAADSDSVSESIGLIGSAVDDIAQAVAHDLLKSAKP